MGSSTPSTDGINLHIPKDKIKHDMNIRDQSFVLVSGGRGKLKYHTLNTTVAQLKNCPFRITRNTTIEPKNVTASDSNALASSGVYFNQQVYHCRI
jgi:hypothetical protein